MWSAIQEHIRAAQGFAGVYLLLGAFAYGATALAWFLRVRDRSRVARLVAAVGAVTGGVACGFALIGFAVVRHQASAAIATSTLVPPVLERILRTGDDRARAIVEFGLVCGALPALFAVIVLRRPKSEGGNRGQIGNVVAAVVAVAVAVAIVCRIWPLRGRQLDRREWLLLDAHAEAEGGDLGTACQTLGELRDQQPVRYDVNDGPYAAEKPMTVTQITALTPEAPELLRRCITYLVDLDRPIESFERDGWLDDPDMRRFATAALEARNRSPRPTPPRASAVDLVNLDIRGAASPSRVRDTLQSEWDGVRACFAQAVVFRAWIRGDVEVRFQIDQNGFPVGVEVSTRDFPDGPPIPCLSKHFGSVSYDAREARGAKISLSIRYLGGI